MKCLAVFLLVIALIATQTEAFYGPKSAVVTLTPETFDQVTKSDDLWLVEFFAPWCGHCKRLTPEWEKAAKALKGIAKVGAMDADKHGEFGQKFGVQGFPTLKMFSTDKSKPKDMETRTADDIVSEAVKEMKRIANKRLTGKEEEEPASGGKKQQSGGGFYDGTDVVVLTDENFEKEVLQGKDAWLVEFYAPWCGHCKNLAPEWKKAASQLAGTFKIAAVDATEQKEVASKYGIQGFPTIKFFPPGGAEPEEYNGGRTAEAIVDYCNKKAEIYPSAPPEVNQIATQEDLTNLCKSKNLCLVFIVPHVIDTGAEGRNKYIEMMVTVATKLRSRSLAAGWIVGGDHLNFEETFGIHATYPTFIAVNFNNKRFATFRGQFSEEKTTTFVRKILEGKVGTSQLKGDIPALEKGIPLWDGKDYVPPEEDE